MKKISILGCGWLGKPLSQMLSSKHIVECFDREKTLDRSEFYGADLLIIAIHTKDNYIETLDHTMTHLLPTTKVILLSSISVYEDSDSTIDESSPTKSSSIQSEAEALIREFRSDATILRVGGLMGEDRVAGRWKSVSSFKDGYVNYIHKDDAIGIIARLIESDINGGIYNLVAPLHPARSEVHAQNAKTFGFELGSFSGFSNKIVEATKIADLLEYEFKYPDPLAFWS